jgi:ribosomal protein S21
VNKKVSPAIPQKLAHAYGLYNQGLIKEAEDVAIQILKKTIDEAYAFNLLGIIKLRESDLEPAINALKKSCKLSRVGMPPVA